MNGTEDFIGRIEEYLDDFDGPTPLPDHVRDAIHADLPATRQVRPVAGSRGLLAMLPRRILPIRPRPIAFAIAMAVILVGVSLGVRRTDLAQAAPLGSIDGQRWVDSPDVAVTIQRDPSDDRDFYWRAAVYDQIDRVGISIGHPMTTARPPASSLLAGMADDVDPAGQDRFTFTVHPVSLTRPLVLSPATPILIDRDVRLTTVGQDGYFAMVELANLDTYTVTALVPSGGTATGSPDTSALRAAGTAYPPEIVTLYMAEQAGVVGPNLRALKDKVVRTAASAAPIDRVERLLQVLGAPPYTYDVNAGSTGCETMSVAECFATTKHGFCVQYATTMAVVLREMGMPARVVEGFLPGTRKAGSDVEVIGNANAHAWVEVYFPGQGWVAFDPTSRILPTIVPR